MKGEASEPAVVLGLNTPLHFGKYKGLSVEAIGKFDPLYLLWMKQNLERVAMSDEAVAYAKPLWSKAYRQSIERQNGWAWGCGAAVKAEKQASSRRAISIEIAEREKAGLR